MTKRVLLTGATGLIGRGVWAELRNHHEVVLTSRNSSDLPINQFVPFDFGRTELIQDFLDKARPSVIVHTAAMTSIEEVFNNPRDAKRLNVDAVSEIALWCEKNGSRLIHFSSDFVFDGERTDYNEADLTNPLSSYGRTKLESEKVVQLNLRNHLIIRPILVYGYFENLTRMNFPLLIASKLGSGERMSITEDQIRMPTHISDITEVIRKALFSNDRGILHLSGPEALSVYEFALKVAESFQLDANLLIPVKTKVDNVSENRPLKSGFDLERAKRIFDYHPKSIEEGLRLFPI